MYKHFKLIAPVAALIAVTACDKVEEGCKEEKYAAAIISEFPDSLKKGITHELRVQYIVENSCGEFVEFEKTTAGTDVDVKIKMIYEGCNCALEFKEQERYFPLVQQTPGTYHYKFWISDTEYDSFVLAVYD